MIKMLTIACVLKTGQFKNQSKIISYNSSQVFWLKAQVDQYITIPHRFICLSDIDIPNCETIPLINNWPGWWSKMELFRPGLFDGPVFYLDLDTVIINNIDKMVRFNKDKYFLVLRNLFRCEGFGSGVMAWRGDFSQLYDIFKSDANYYQRDYSRDIKRWGDQGFLEEHLHGAVYFQDIFSDWIISYFFDMLKRGIKNPPRGSRLICFQGKPKPWDVRSGWIPKLQMFGANARS